MPERRHTFRESHRLTHALQFRSVQQRGYRQSRGPLTVIALPNDLPHCRLGLSISRRVGNAVVRSRLKRMLRESFRLEQHDLPATLGTGYDLVIVARAHAPLELADYREHLRAMVARLDKAFARHARNTSEGSP